MMKQSILQLESYKFIEFSVRCDGNGELEDWPEAFKVDDFEFSLEDLESDDELHQAFIRLTVSSKSEDLEKSSFGNFYSVKIVAIAQLSFSSDAPARFLESKDTANKVLVMNGANILYGLMRDRLESLTGSMPWGGVILPLATFDGLMRTKEPKSETAGRSETS
ncbi:hypothetical protein [Microbulbifer sp. SSSA005]|uniref:hypothetical protein n=1 Tax=Microbulbifer sp. SSSA005 TaxID=3243378 RepID=UPI00403943AE